MIIDDEIFINALVPLIKSGLSVAENTRKYYDILNNQQARSFIIDNDLGTPQFTFLSETLDDQQLTKCPNCGHYNDNIECPILRCSICDFEWKVNTKHSDSVCETCIAYKTKDCEKKPKRKLGENHGYEQT